jgi:hypothetical protein
MIAFKERLKCALEAEKMLQKSAPLPPPPPSASGGAAPPPLPLHLASPSADEAKVRADTDITYGVRRFGEQPKPLAFAHGIDAFSAVVGALICSGQGPNFANSIAERICFQVWGFFIDFIYELTNH